MPLAPTVSLYDGEAPGRLRRNGNWSNFLQIKSLPSEGRRREVHETQKVPETNHISRIFIQVMEATIWWGSSVTRWATYSWLFDLSSWVIQRGLGIQLPQDRIDFSVTWMPLGYPCSFSLRNSSIARLELDAMVTLACHHFPNWYEQIVVLISPEKSYTLEHSRWTPVIQWLSWPHLPAHILFPESQQELWVPLAMVLTCGMFITRAVAVLGPLYWVPILVYARSQLCVSSKVL